MKIIKRVLVSVLTLLIIAVGGFYLYIQSLPTSAPQVVNASDLNKQQKALNFSCNPSGDFNYAYQVKVNVESVLNNKIAYHSVLNFNTQLNQANGSIIKGIATDITINEGEGNHSIEDIYYLSRVEGNRYALFSAFNDLGLSKQHPMKMLSQLLKALSVGEEGESYLFTYDQLQRTYQYRQQGNKVERASHTSTANLNQLKTLFNEYKNQWSVTLGQDCVPEKVISEELQGIAAGGHGGHIKFSVEANRIPVYTVMADDKHNDIANIQQSWQVKQVGENEFDHAVNSNEQMWDIFTQFSQSKNTSQLIKAAEYMLDNVPTYDLANTLTSNKIDEEVKRDLIFGLGISQSPEVENYLLSTLNELPTAAGTGVDLQKVRLMVALSGNSQVTESAFLHLEELLGRSDETPNVQANALINMGAVVTQLNNNGQTTSHLSNSLERHIREQLNTPNSAAAMMAAGNAKLDNMDNLYLQKLASAKTKERYAASKVLARNTEHYDRLINHVTAEKSNLVVNAIITSMDVSKLSAQQRTALQGIASQDNGDKGKIVQAFLTR